MMVILFVLGMFLDWVGILLLTVPIFLPIMKSLEWSAACSACRACEPEDVPLWYGVIFMVNMQMAFLSPPFGYSLFYLKSVAPPEITHGDDLPLGGALHGAAVARRRALHPLSADHSVAAKPPVFALTRGDVPARELVGTRVVEAHDIFRRAVDHSEKVGTGKPTASTVRLAVGCATACATAIDDETLPLLTRPQRLHNENRSRRAIPSPGR